ncbi:hypothetical protein PO124_26755 [Bacillus licheniformis]|nr:hypothetical protein [Bacillus licheniformis]
MMKLSLRLIKADERSGDSHYSYQKVTDVVEENIPFEVRKKRTIHLKGKEKLYRTVNMASLKALCRCYENGKEVSRELIKEETAAESKAKSSLSVQSKPQWLKSARMYRAEINPQERNLCILYSLYSKLQRMLRPHCDRR